MNLSLRRHAVHMLRYAVALFAVLSANVAGAEPFKVEQIGQGLWAIEGPKGQRDPENLGNNATFGLIETEAGAVLVDAGGSFAGAKALDATISTLTAQPVVYVINTGGQDHRWLGNGYWQAKGAHVIASEAAVEDQEDRVSLQMTMLSQLVGGAMAGTEPAFAETIFANEHKLELGGRRFEIKHAAPAHTPGDAFVWLPDERVVFSGDIVYIERLLGVMPFSDSAGWLEAFAAMAALDPAVVVPGHGPATTLERARAQTEAYLINLREQMRAYIDDGGEIIGSVDVDQSAFEGLELFENLARRNAQTVFEQMEWE